MSVVGSLVSVLFQKINKFLPLVTAIVGGLVASYLCAPLIMAYYPTIDHGIIGLIMGLIGINIITSILKIGEYLQKNVVALVNKVIRKKLNIEEIESCEPTKKKTGKSINMGEINDIDLRR